MMSRHAWEVSDVVKTSSNIMKLPSAFLSALSLYLMVRMWSSYVGAGSPRALAYAALGTVSILSRAWGSKINHLRCKDRECQSASAAGLANPLPWPGIHTTYRQPRSSLSFDSTLATLEVII